ncbi:MAG TPA: hypothetical protein VFF06_00455 [Polyangia bacterium]|nr:hypothetical protein [Polyangia bacterium]
MVGSTKCGTGCKTDSDCGHGLYCGSSSTCVADCTAGGSSCGPDETCDATGRCVSLSGGPDLAGAIQCPDGLMCNVACAGGTSTTISGKVYDPAGKNGLYNVAVYVPAGPLAPLPKGVPTGSDACSCAALYSSGAIVSTSTAEDGTFTLSNAPVGSSVPLVIQVGKWRRQYHVSVTSCQDNPQSNGSLAFPTTVAAGNTDDNIPDIAVSTGSADTLECLMRRIGIDAGEYVAGNASTGHVHVFSGGSSAGGGGFGGGGSRAGRPEQPAMPGAPSSPTDLWSTQAQLMPYDIVLLSCEGGETYNANPPALEAYLDAGGRVFASHFHYAWFAGPLGSNQSYSAPMDWGPNLASWAAGSGMSNGPIGGVIQTTLNGSTMPFPKGVSLQKWLTNVNALGQNGVPSGELSIYQPRYNSTVAATNTPSQPWITSDASGMAGSTMYLSFDTPVNPPVSPDNIPAYCGRAVFSDLHVSGDPTTSDQSPPPGGCANTDLSPQEKALEFMLFDLSSCVIPDTVAPPMGVPLQ